MGTRIGELEVSYSARGNPSYFIEMWHDELKKHRLVKGNDAEVVARKALIQAQEWNDYVGLRSRFI